MNVFKLEHSTHSARPFQNAAALKLRKLSIASCRAVAAIAILASAAHAQTLLYQWNFDNATGSGSSFSAVPSAGTGALGILSNLNSGAGPAAPASSGLSGAASDLALVQPVYGAGGAGAIGGLLGDLSGVSGFTVSAWFNLDASASNFGAYGSAGALNSRLFDIGNTSNGDGNRLYFALNTGTNLQFGVNQAGSTGPFTGQQGTSSGAFSLFGNAPSTMTNNWIFVAGSYSTALNGSVNLYVGSRSVAASLVGTLTNVGLVSWESSGDYAYIGNRPSNGTRALPGAIDDVRLYSGAADQSYIGAFIQGVPEPGAAALMCLGLFSMFARRRQR
jgi:hypothetical protein